MNQTLPRESDCVTHTGLQPASWLGQIIHLRRLTVKTLERVLFVNVEDIGAIEAAGKYSVVHAGKERHVLRETMNSLESHPPPDRFLRISRSVIVNIARVQELQPIFKGENIVVLKNGKQIPVTRSLREIRRRLESL